MITRREMAIEMEIEELELENERLRKEILLYNRLQSLNEAHLAVALAKLGATNDEPIMVTKGQIQDAMQELAVRVERSGDNVSLWYEVI